MSEDAPRQRRRLVIGLAGVAAVLVLATIIGSVIAGLDWRTFVETYTLTNLVMGAGFASCGVLIAWHRPSNPIGWLLLAAGLTQSMSAAMTAPLYYGANHGWPMPVVGTISTILTGSWQIGLVGLFPLALLLFPTGRYPSGWWAPAAWLLIVSAAWQTLTGVLSSGNVIGHPRAESIISVNLEVPEPLAGVMNVLSVASVLPVLAALIVRFVRGGPTQRRQFVWLILAVILIIIINSQRFVTGDGPILLLLSFTLIPIAITVAILRHQALDIRLFISRTVLYFLASVVVIAVYATLVALLSLALPTGGDQTAAIAAALVVALMFAPLRSLLQRIVDRAFYGSRSDPLRAATRLGEGLSDDAANTLDATRRELRLPFLALRDVGGTVTSAGEPLEFPGTVVSLPLTYAGESAGELEIGLRQGETALHEDDRRVFSLLSPALALAMRATTLAEDLRESRAGIVLAREEERKRLHRDLHDGLGPVLTGAAFSADAASNVMDADPAEAHRLLTGVRGDLRRALDDVRRVVYAIRPIDLQERGLVGALTARTSDVRLRDGRLMRVRLELEGPLDTLPAAAQLAVYRIVVESLANAARHSDAESCDVRVAASDSVTIEITDDGSHIGEPWTAGVGISSIIARAEELGGMAVVGPTASGGRVFAELPGV